MIEREKAIKSASNRRIETPETRRLLDYSVGDIVQIKADGGKHAGEIGVILGIRVFRFKTDGAEGLAYTIRLSDKQSIEVSAGRMSFLRHSEKAAGEA